jgi:hypothetical protein
MEPVKTRSSSRKLVKLEPKEKPRNKIAIDIKPETLAAQTIKPE